MDGPASKTSTPLDSSTPETAADSLTRLEEVPLEIEGDHERGRTVSYSILIQGEVRASSLLSSRDPAESVTLLENDTKLLCGSVHGDTAGFVVAGDVLAAEFDEPEPTVKLDGAIVDTRRWPTVKEYVGYGPGGESVEDPFPESGELGAPPRDPLDPEEYHVELDARDLEETEAFCFDVDGEVVDQPDGTTVSARGDRVYGCLHPGTTATITVRGVITRVETADGIDFSVSAR
jgi:hypothetical protein